MRLSPLCLLLLLSACDDGGDKKAEGRSQQSDIEKAVKSVEQASAKKERVLDHNRLSPALKLLPAGSTLKDVRIPFYDQEMRRASLVRADILKVLSEERLTSDNIEMRRFSKNEQEILRVHMGAADYLVTPGLLEATEVITVSGEHLRASGTGGIFLLDSRQGFVHGPVATSLFRPSGKKATGGDEKPEPAPRPALAELVPEFLEPTALSRAELEEIDALVQSRSKSVLADRAPTKELKTRSEQLSQVAEIGLQSFSRQVKRGNLLNHDSTGGPGFPREAGKALEDGELRVTSNGGMYLDYDKGHLAYLREIEVTESSFTITCSDRLLIFFAAKESGNGTLLNGQEEFGDPKTIVATGGVRVERRDPKGKGPPIIASAETAIVDVAAGDFVLQGGAPTIRQGLNVLRAEDPDLYLRYYANGDIFAEEGRWTTVGNLASLKAGKDGEDGKKEIDASDQRPANAQEAGEIVTGPEAGDAPGQDGAKAQTITVTCTGGIYFDAKEGQLVYLGDIEIAEPRFRITCTEELKAFLRRKPDAATDGGTDGGTGLEAFSEVDFLVASGEVRVTRHDPEDDRKGLPVTASAAHMILDVRSRDIILRGGSPAVRQGPNSLQAGAPDLYLRFYENGSLFAERGAWTTTGDLANLQTKPGEARKPEETITVTSRGGLFFDSLKGHIVYLEDIVVLEPRFRMDCKERMTIYLQERAAAEGERLEGPEAFSDVKGIRATGGVTVVRRDPDGKAEPITASADTAVYEAKSGDVALLGGYPAIRQGRNFAKAQEPDLYIRFYQDGRYYAKTGKWDMNVQAEGFEKLRERNERR